MLKRIVLSLVCLAALAAPAAASPITFSVYLSGPAESPTNSSPGTGFAVITIDDVAHTLAIDLAFQNLLAGNTASHIHVLNGPGDLNTLDTLGPVATTTPTFTGFPGGTTAGTFSAVFNTLLASTYRAGFITDAGGVPQAEAALFAGIIGGNAYLNIHTTVFPSGEIRGFLQPVPEPGTLLLVGGGLAGIMRKMRRRRAI